MTLTSSAMDPVDGDHEFNDEEIDDHSHKKLLNAVTQLYRKQRIAAPKRNEPSQQISEFNLTKPNKQRKLGAADLLCELRQRAAHHQVSNKVRAIQGKAAPLPKPLEKFVAEKIAKQSGYSVVRGELGEWEALVQKNRAADQLKFPLLSEKLKFERESDFLNTTKPSDLELKMAEALRKGLAVQEGKPEQSQEIEKLSLEEVLQRRQMVAKMRARESYRIAKAVRQNKIKSKKYHRVLKRERIKKELKEFELLQKTDPEAALAKMEKIERARAEERISLRHRNTGKWARGLAIRSKYDVEARAQLADNLRKSRELTNKAKMSMESDSEEEGYEDIDLTGEGAIDKNNPWVDQEDKEISSFISGYRKFWEEQNKLKEQKNLETKVSTRRAPNGGEAESQDIPVELDAAVFNGNSDLPEESSIEETNDKVEEGNNNSNAKEDQTDSPKNTGLNELNKDVVEDESKIKEAQNDQGCNQGVTQAATKTAKKRRGRKRKSKVQQTKDGNSISLTQDKDEKGNVETVGKNQKRGKTAKKRILALANSSGDWTVIEEGTEAKTPTDLSANDKADELSQNDKKRAIENLFEAVEISTVVKQSGRSAKKTKSVAFKELSEEKTKKKPEKSHLDLSFKKLESKSVDESLIEVAFDGEGISSGLNDMKTLLKKVENAQKQPDDKVAPDIDPSNFLPVKTQKVNTTILNMVEDAESDSDEEKSQHLNLMEAFADDDIADEFRKEKEEEEKGSKQTEVDMTLPGWGSWAGPGVVFRKRKNSIVKFPAVPRKDRNKPTIIINDILPKEFVAHQVSDLPPQFENVATYEGLIRAPIGNTWVPQAIHNTLIEPKVVTKMGHIIQPLDRSELVKKDDGALKGMEDRGQKGRFEKNKGKIVKRSGETHKRAKNARCQKNGKQKS